MAREFSFTQADYEQVASHLYRIAGIHLGDTRKEMVYSRLSREVRRLRLDSVSAYLAFLDKAGQHEWTRFTNVLTTNLTSFFREQHHFGILAEKVLLQAGRPVRIWSCGCASGEEPYSIAMVCDETLGSASGVVSILATDVNTTMLQEAEAGVFDSERVEGLAPERLRRYFLDGSGAYAGKVKVKPVIRRSIVFRMLNLMQPVWGLEDSGQFDAIFCRNVMIYFDKEGLQEVVWVN